MTLLKSLDCSTTLSRRSLRRSRNIFLSSVAATKTTWVTDNGWSSWLTKRYAKVDHHVSTVRTSTPYSVPTGLRSLARSRDVLLALLSLIPPIRFVLPALNGETSHPTIRDAQHGISILQRFASEFQLPSPEEGYDHIIYLRPEDHPHAEYTRNDVLSILERLQATTRDTETAVTQHRLQSRFRPGGTFFLPERTRGYRGLSAYQYNLSAQATLHDTSRLVSRGSGSSDWRRPSSVGVPDRARSDQRSSTANIPLMERSKGKDSGTEFLAKP